MMKLFDVHCHLQDPRILSKTPQLIVTAQDNGVVYFAVNGLTEKDWHLVKEMSETYPSVIPSFGLHPWFVGERNPNWFEKLKEFLYATPFAAIGEVGLDKGPRGSQINFSEQVEVLRQQLELAKELNRPVSIHCVHALGHLLQLMKSMGPFPAGFILHSYTGSAEMVPVFYKLGAYFSFSGHNMSQHTNKAKAVLKMVPSDRILLESGAPGALPRLNKDFLFFVEGDASLLEEFHGRRRASSNSSHPLMEASMFPRETLNHPANIHTVLSYIAFMLEISKEELAESSYQNAVRLFSYGGSKVCLQKLELHPN